MSDVLHLKYRPQSLADVIGQDHLIAPLQQVLTKRSAHSFLFDGPAGCGKTSLARICAAAFGATEVIEVDAATYASVDNVRMLTANLQYSSLTGQRALIIDECHRLSKQAWDALLKSIEEPPDWVTWFFCTTDPGRVPDTIKTRCARFSVRAVPWQVLVDQLLLPVAEIEGLVASEPVVRLCAKEARGSPRQALVNLALCANFTEAVGAADALASALESAEAVELARALVKGEPWANILKLLNALSELDPESVRRVVVSYVSAALLGAESEKSAAKGMAILAAFGTPFYPGDGVAPVLLACGRLFFA